MAFLRANEQTRIFTENFESQNLYSVDLSQWSHVIINDLICFKLTLNCIIA